MKYNFKIDIQEKREKFNFLATMQIAEKIPYVIKEGYLYESNQKAFSEGMKKIQRIIAKEILIIQN